MSSFEELVSKLQALDAEDAEVSALLDAEPTGTARYKAVESRWLNMESKIESVAEKLSLRAPNTARQELVLILIGLKGLVGVSEDDEAIAALRGAARSAALRAGLGSPEEMGVLVSYWRHACELETRPAAWKKSQRRSQIRRSNVIEAAARD